MNDLRSPLEDRPYRPATRSFQDDRVISTPEYYRSKFDTLRQSRWFPLASVAAAVLIFGGIISYAYKQGSSSGVNATTPIVQASNEEYKEKPTNPGGMDVPFQDAVVFDQLSGTPAKTASADTVESLLPDAEKPVDTTTTAATTAPAATTTETTTTASTAAPTTETLTDPSATNTATIPQETAAATTTTTTETTASLDKLPTFKDVPAETSKTTTTTAMTTTKTTPATASTEKKATDVIAKKMDQVAPASAPATTKIQSGNYRIQLGAFRDEAAARSAWTKLQKEFHSQLATVTPDFKRADLGAKGVFYRVQGINLSKATADELCRSINSAKSGACLVAR